jgi:hypothetical protein
MRVKICAECPYSPRDLANYYDANSNCHLCFRCDSKRAPAKLGIVGTASVASQRTTAENILNGAAQQRLPPPVGGTFELISRTRTP